MQIPFQIGVEGKSIMGMLHIPKSRANGSPVIIMCYGFNGNRVEQHRMSVLAGREAERLGICLARYDYRGQGISDGEFWQINLEDRLKDVLAIIDYIDGCFQSDKYSLFLLGFSDGARFASSVSSMRGEMIKGLCMWSPIFSENSTFFKGKALGRLIREPLTKELVYPFYGLCLGLGYLRQLKDYNSFESFCNYPGPKLCIFGSHDRSVKYTIEAIHNIKAGSDLQVKTIYGAKHVYGKSSWSEEVIKLTFDWIKEVVS